MWVSKSRDFILALSLCLGRAGTVLDNAYGLGIFHLCWVRVGDGQLMQAQCDHSLWWNIVDNPHFKYDI